MLNKYMCIGRLAADPNIRWLPDNSPIATLRVAVTTRWRDKQSGARRERTVFVPFVCFNDHLCDVISKYAKKGVRVYAEGEFQMNTWEKAGEKHRTPEFVLDVIQVLDLPPRQTTPENGASRSMQSDLDGAKSL